MIIRKISNLINRLRQVEKKQDELIWAATWHDTIHGLSWTKDIGSISPGRWAVGYNYLYVMTRILEETEPNRVLDLGLGISTTLITNYFANKTNDGVEHIVVEHNEDWISFYLRKHKISENTKIVQRDIVHNDLETTSYCSYKDLGEIIRGKKFNVISIDAPYGGEAYSRRDILDYLPDILDESFVIIMDDYNRVGEKKTVETIMEKLTKNNIAYHFGYYSGVTDCCVIVSDNNSFICSL